MERKGTIVYIGGFEMPDKNAAAHRVLNNAKIFHKLGYHVVFCGIDHDILENAKEITKIVFFDNIPSAYPKSNMEWAKQLVDFSHIKQTFNRYDDIKFAVAYNMHAVPLARLLHYCKTRNIKVVADVTEWYENKFSLNPIKFVKFFDTFFVMHYLQKKVDAIVAVSSLLKQFYESYVKKIIVVPPLVDLSDSKWNTSGIVKEPYLEFVYSGVPGVGEKKDLLGCVIRSFAQLGKKYSFRFTILGLTKEQFVASFFGCEKELQELGDKVIFKGRVSHRDSIAALYKADYCIFVRNRSRKNMAGFPTKFVECYTSGVGIIANNVSDIAQYFPKSENSFLLSDTNEDSILKKLKCIFKFDLVKLRQMQQNCNRIQFFDYNRWEKLFMEVFN